ncbi:MAG: hypothetical protein KAH32_03195 [Chlamydiia bacterium]|nr:hypothetical protein [Chlamydiia bacterium]
MKDLSCYLGKLLLIGGVDSFYILKRISSSYNGHIVGTITKDTTIDEVKNLFFILNLSNSSSYESSKALIIFEVENIKKHVLNACLKFLESIPSHVAVIAISSDINCVLKTIKSRSVYIDGAQEYNKEFAVQVIKDFHGNDYSKNNLCNVENLSEFFLCMIASSRVFLDKISSSINNEDLLLSFSTVAKKMNTQSNYISEEKVISSLYEMLINRSCITAKNRGVSMSYIYKSLEKFSILNKAVYSDSQMIKERFSTHLLNVFEDLLTLR